MTNTEIAIIKTNIQAQLKNKLISPLFISGAPGTAKSATVKQLAKQMNMGLIEYSCPILSIESLSGLPEEEPSPEYNNSAIINSSKDVISTVWTIPEIIARCWAVSKEQGDSVLLLDDFHSVAPHVQSYFYSLLLERRIGNYKLPDNVVIIGTMNDSEAAGFNGIGSAVRNRMSILQVKFNFDYWFKGFGNRLHYLVASFLSAKPAFSQEDESVGIEGYATARAWTAIANELSFYEEDFIAKNAKTIAGMQVSAEAAQAFQAHVNYIAAIDFTKTVKARNLVDLATKDPLDSIVYAYITNFIHTIDDGMYLIDLMDVNANDNSSAFIGFVLGELFIKFQNEETEKLSEGLQYVIDILLERKAKSSRYPKTSEDKLKKAFGKKVLHLDTFRLRASEYLI